VWHPDDARHSTYLLHQEKKNLRPQRPDAEEAQDGSDTTSLTRTPLVMALGILTQLPRQCVFGCTELELRASRCSSPGRRASRPSCHSICFLDEECQGMCLLYVGVKANGVRTTYTTAPCLQTQVLRDNWSGRNCHGKTRSDVYVEAQLIWTQLPRENTFRCKYQGTTRPDAATTAKQVRTQVSRHHTFGRHSYKGTKHHSEASAASAFYDTGSWHI
jgi:hypothetical protein